MLETKHKRFILALIILAVLAGIITFVHNEQKNKSAEVTVAPEDFTKLPPFASGKISRIEGNKIYVLGISLNEAEREYEGIVGSETKIAQQQVIRGLPALGYVTMAELKVGQSVTVFFTDRNENTLMLDRIQIIE